MVLFAAQHKPAHKKNCIISKRLRELTMSANLKLAIFASLFCFSISAAQVKFDNQSSRDITFFLAFKKLTGSKGIPVPAMKNKEESLEEFFKKAPLDTPLWIYARYRKKAPYRDIYCSPTVKVGDLAESEAKWKIIYTGDRCEVLRE